MEEVVSSILIGSTQEWPAVPKTRHPCRVFCRSGPRAGGIPGPARYRERILLPPLRHRRVLCTVLVAASVLGLASACTDDAAFDAPRPTATPARAFTAAD